MTLFSLVELMLPLNVHLYFNSVKSILNVEIHIILEKRLLNFNFKKGNILTGVGTSTFVTYLCFGEALKWFSSMLDYWM